MAPIRVSAAMEHLTVHNTSYRPIPLPLPVCRCRTPVKRTLAPSVVITAHREAYRPREPQEPIKTKPPRDHGFLTGDGLDRFHSTSYRTHYPVTDGEMHRGNDCSQEKPFYQDTFVCTASPPLQITREASDH